MVLTIRHRASSLAGQGEEETLWRLATLPIPRSRIVLQKVGAMATQGADGAVMAGASVLLRSSIGVTASLDNLVVISVSYLQLGMDFGVSAVTADAVLGRRGAATGATAALAAASLLLVSTAPAVNFGEPGR